MLVRVIRRDDTVVCEGKKDASQKWSNARRSGGALKTWACKSYKPKLARRFIRRQGHKLVGGLPNET